MEIKIKVKYINEFMRVFATITGIITGAGFLFIGLTRPNFIVSLFGIIALLTGLITASVFVKEEDEYEITR